MAPKSNHYDSETSYNVGKSSSGNTKLLSGKTANFKPPQSQDKTDTEEEPSLNDRAYDYSEENKNDKVNFNPREDAYSSISNVVRPY